MRSSPSPALRLGHGSTRSLPGALYFGLGLAVPLLLSWRPQWLIAANVFGTMSAGVLVLVWIATLVQAGRRRDPVEWTPVASHSKSAEGRPPGRSMGLDQPHALVE